MGTWRRGGEIIISFKKRKQKSTPVTKLGVKAFIADKNSKKNRKATGPSRSRIRSKGGNPFSCTNKPGRKLEITSPDLPRPLRKRPLQ